MKPSARSRITGAGHPRTAGVILAVIVLSTVASCKQNDSTRQGAKLVDSGRPVEAAPVPGDRRSKAIAGERQEPLHGGVVHSVDVYHVEVVQRPFEVWLYDRNGQEIPASRADGRVVLYRDEGTESWPLEGDDRLRAGSEIDLPPDGMAFLELTVDEQPIDIALRLGSETSEPADAN